MGGGVIGGCYSEGFYRVWEGTVNCFRPRNIPGIFLG